jgi:hypothetical protein
MVIFYINSSQLLIVTLFSLSRPELREPFYVSILGWSGCGHSMFCFLCFFISMFWPGMVVNQGQLSIVVSDWESYLGSGGREGRVS